MTLHEAIQEVLREANQPLPAKVIASTINGKGYYKKTNDKPLESGQILSRVRKYPSLFHNINGQIILVEDKRWKNLLTSYWYLVNVLKGIFMAPDIQFIIAILFFYKRLADINHRPGKRLPVDFFKELSSFDELMDGGNSFLKGVLELERYTIAPQGVFEEWSTLFSKLDNYKKQEIRAVLKQIDTSEFQDKEFGNIYEYFLNLDLHDGYKSKLYQTPYSLRELMVNVLAPQSGAKIYDPVCGIGGLLIQSAAYKNNNYVAIGTEINKRVAQLGSLNLIMHGIDNVSIHAGDCFEEINNHKDYDYIIADLPTNKVTIPVEYYMLYSHWELEAPKSGRMLGAFILLILSKLKPQGKAAITVPDSFLVKKGHEKAIRDLLVKRDLIETIISLPYGVLRPFTDAKASIIVLNKNKPNYLLDKIQFITGKASDQDNKSLDLDIEGILDAYFNKKVFFKDSQVVELTALREHTNLSVEAYNAQFIEGTHMLKEGSGKILSELVEICSGMQPDKVDLVDDGEIPFVKIENLSRDVLDINLTNEVNGKTHFSLKYKRAVIKEDCILVARIGESLKPTIFKPSAERPQIMIPTGIYALIPRKKGNTVINLEYLYYQLCSPFIKDQIKDKQLGNVMPYISIAGLKQIVIPYMDLTAQVGFVKSQKANLIAEERARVEERIKALDYKEEVAEKESDIVRTLVHQLRPTLVNIDLQVKSLKRIVDKNNLTHFSENLKDTKEQNIEITRLVEQIPNYTLSQVIERLANDTIRLNDTLTTVNKVMSFTLSSKDMTTVNLLTFFKKYLESKKTGFIGNFQIEVTGEEFNVEINEVSFKELIDQLLLNASEHGFKDSTISLTKRKVQFNIQQNKERKVAVIGYQNNGKAFKLMHTDFIKLFYKGQKSIGTGIGGNYIYRIVQAHKGKVEVKESISTGFSMLIELPLIQNKDYE